MDQAFNVNLKENLMHKSTYLKGYVKKSVIYEWLRFLVEQPLYKYLGVTVDMTVFDQNDMKDPPLEETDRIEFLNLSQAPESE